MARALRAASEYDESFGAGDGGVEVALQQGVGVHGQWDDHGGVLAALGAVHGGGVGVLQFVEFVEVVVDVFILVGGVGGDASISVVRNEPYRLAADVWGMGSRPPTPSPGRWRSRRTARRGVGGNPVHPVRGR
jgi:hypothetical protein